WRGFLGSAQPDVRTQDRTLLWETVVGHNWRRLTRAELRIPRKTSHPPHFRGGISCTSSKASSPTRIVSEPIAARDRQQGNVSFPDNFTARAEFGSGST